MVTALIEDYSGMRRCALLMPFWYQQTQCGSCIVHLSSDQSVFHTIPWGVDHKKFHPLDKQKAKNEIAKMLNKPQIASLPVVGFFSRFQPEKGAGIYIKIAKRLPHTCFLMTAPTLNFYEHQQLPSNLICAPQQPRDQLARLINAFDVYCFPSMVGEETFGLALLETMACGVPPVVPRLDGLPEVVGDAGSHRASTGL